MAVRSIVKSVFHLPVSLEIGGNGTETMSDNYGERATGCSQQRPENLFISPARKAPLVELKPTGPHEATKPASFNDLVKAMTEAFKLSVAKPSTSTSDPIGRRISLNQPKPYSLGKKFHVMVIGIRGILKAC